MIVIVFTIMVQFSEEEDKKARCGLDCRCSYLSAYHSTTNTKKLDSEWTGENTCWSGVWHML